jgi:beta-1,4-mannosyl-glycoprotein beta-1,4-N-acetylglucosaminyltransferase
VKLRWGASKIIGYNVYTKSCGRLPQIIRNFPSIQIRRGGWHLSYFGDGNFIRTKLLSFAEQNFNDESILDECHINDCIEKGKDLLNRTDETFSIEKCSIEDNDYLPFMHETYLTKYM